MDRKTVRLTVFVGLMLVSSAAAAGALQPCALLTGDEIARELGLKVSGEPLALDLNPDKTKDLGMTGCMYSLGEKGGVHLGAAPAPQGPGREEAMAKLREVFTQLKAKGWGEEKAVLGTATCYAMTPPKGEASSPIMVTCLGEAKGRVVSVGTMTIANEPALAQIKTLYDKVVARLP